MKFKEMVYNLLRQLRDVIDKLSNEQYTQQLEVLSKATIGQHTRHILEFYIELDRGYLKGIVNYDKRMRDQAIESDKNCAIRNIAEVESIIVKLNKELLLQGEYTDGEGSPQLVSTNYFRELIYNLDHTIHHMALIRIGVNAISDIEIPKEFGVAESTLRYRKSCVQ